MTRTAFLVLMLCLIATACGDNEPTAAPSSGYAGRWSGTVLVLHLWPPGQESPRYRASRFRSRSQQISDEHQR